MRVQRDVLGGRKNETLGHGVSLLCVALALLCASGVASADIVYSVNLTGSVPPSFFSSGGTETVAGTITTDGTFGALTAADIVAYSLTASGVVPASIAGGVVPFPAQVSCDASGCGVTATNTTLTFNGATGTSLGLEDFSNLVVLPGQPTTIQVVVFTSSEVIVRTIVEDGLFISLEADFSVTGPYALDGTSTGTVPEPSTLALLGFGLFGVALARRQSSSLEC